MYFPFGELRGLWGRGAVIVSTLSWMLHCFLHILSLFKKKYLSNVPITVDIQYHISFRCTPQGLDIDTTCKIVTVINPVPPWHHALLQYCWLYSMRCASHLLDYSAAPYLYFLTPSPFSPSPLPFGNHPKVLCTNESPSVLLFHLFCFLESTYKWNHTAFVLLCLT